MCGASHINIRVAEADSWPRSSMRNVACAIRHSLFAMARQLKSATAEIALECAAVHRKCDGVLVSGSQQLPRIFEPLQVYGSELAV